MEEIGLPSKKIVENNKNNSITNITTNMVKVIKFLLLFLKIKN